jgi:glycosyltransferase involved in cell wall biosynthesis
VLFLGYSFGLPAIAADVGTLEDEIIEGQTGIVFRAQDSSHLASKIEEYFKSELFRNLETNRFQIKEYANERYLWSKVAPITTLVYASL